MARLSVYDTINASSTTTSPVALTFRHSEKELGCHNISFIANGRRDHYERWQFLCAVIANSVFSYSGATFKKFTFAQSLLMSAFSTSVFIRYVYNRIVMA